MYVQDYDSRYPSAKNVQPFNCPTVGHTFTGV